MERRFSEINGVMINSEKKIWVNGSFDVLHIGHIRLLEFASKFGKVKVGIDTDERINQKKGIGRPFNSLRDRMDFLMSIKYVDSVTYFGSDEELEEKIKEYNPDIMVIGSEYKYQRIVGAKYVPEIEFFEKIDGYSSTKILSYESLSSWGKVF
jgi:D-beta-D-heptose 7-phosphate kinase/D-beta-D-heptose 1-phosphate adenosyltransferase